MFLRWRRDPPQLCRRRVSNPFVAGQCSSVTLPGVRKGKRLSLQPLRCGAMFLRPVQAMPPLPRSSVSNPFVAGQCSSGQLRRLRGNGPVSSPTPSLRGNVPQGTISLDCFKGVCMSPTPSLRGNVPQTISYDLKNEGEQVSNPFVAGQCSSADGMATDLGVQMSSPTPSLRGNVPQTRVLGPENPECLRSPTPSLRGNVPQPVLLWTDGTILCRSPTPSLRGNVPQQDTATPQQDTATRLQPLRCGAMFLRIREAGPWPLIIGCLQPLRCGAMFLRHAAEDNPRRLRGVSNPFVAGQCSSEL